MAEATDSPVVSRLFIQGRHGIRQKTLRARIRSNCMNLVEHSKKINDLCRYILFLVYELRTEIRGGILVSLWAAHRPKSNRSSSPVNV